MRTKVIVRLVAECDVEMDVEHTKDESPTDLTPDERRRAVSRADTRPIWYVERAEKKAKEP